MNIICGIILIAIICSVYFVAEDEAKKEFKDKAGER